MSRTPLETSREYRSTTTNAKSCYSNIPLYGTCGNTCNTIIAPVAATLRPTMFNYLTPHNIPDCKINRPREQSCNGYSKLKHTCQFGPGFNDVSTLNSVGEWSGCGR